jgi:aspartate-semialdehyde dehydrogenase
MPLLITDPMPESVKNLTLLPNRSHSLQKSVFAFFCASCRHSKKMLSRISQEKVFMFCSNESAYRKDPLVPILVPEVNANHLDILDIQQKTYGWSGGIITNPNCHNLRVCCTIKCNRQGIWRSDSDVFSMQAISGAGILVLLRWISLTM